MRLRKGVVVDMQLSRFIVHSPYEIGDKVKVIFHNGIAVIGGPVTARPTEVTITDILTVHSLKNQQVNFMYEINNDKVFQFIEWEAVKNEIL